VVSRYAPLTALMLAACTAAPAREAAHPSIVSINPCTDAILAEVADPAQIAGLSRYSSDPAASSMDVGLARSFASISGSVEELAALHPDLVIGSTFTPPASVSAMARMGLQFSAFGAASTVADSQAQVRAIAALAGHPERGAALNARIDRALALALPQQGSAVPAIVWQSGGMVAGAGTLISELLSRTGFTNLAAARGMRQADLLPLEVMLADPPRVLFIAGNGRGNEDRLLAHPALRGLTATLRAPLDPALLWCGGPSIPRTVARLVEVRQSFETGLRKRSVPPQVERNITTIRPDERKGLSLSKAHSRLEGHAR
jgi:iron complex transport system substrate-binding protein